MLYVTHFASIAKYPSYTLCMGYHHNARSKQDFKPLD